MYPLFKSYGGENVGDWQYRHKVPEADIQRAHNTVNGIKHDERKHRKLGEVGAEIVGKSGMFFTQGTDDFPERDYGRNPDQNKDWDRLL